MSSLLDASTTTIKVSSTLDRASHRKHLLDRNRDTCWASANGSPQWVSFTLPRLALLKAVAVTFQGGFVPTEVVICTSPSPASGEKLKPKHVTTVYPQDNNFRQMLKIDQVGEGARVEGIVKLEFPKSSDFFGRVVVYDLDLLGEWVDVSGDQDEGEAGDVGGDES